MKKIFLLLALFSILVIPFTGSAQTIGPARGSSSWLLYELEPGDSIEDAVVVRNIGKVEQSYVLYGVDAREEGASFLPESEKNEQTMVGKWIFIPESKVTLAPGESKNVAFTLTMSPEAEKGKTYTGAIVLAPVTEATDTDGNNNESATIQIQTRIAVRLYVKATENPQLTATTGASNSQEGTTSESSTGFSQSYIALLAVLVVVILGIIFYFFNRKK